MRAKAILLCAVFIASSFCSFVNAATPDDITIDGDDTDWPNDSLMESDLNGISVYMTWNSSNLFIGWNGTDWKSTFEGADLFVYFNTSDGGSVLSKEWGFSHALPFEANHGFVL